MNSRTNPKAVGYEQVTDSRPWYTKSGRLEFYREEAEFIEAGENLPVHREPVDSTFYEPNVIVAPKHEAIRPAGPEDYGVAARRPVVRDALRPQRGEDLGGDRRRRRIPLIKDGYRFVFHTPKYRHGAHTTPIDTDMVAVLFGPFGDLYRHDKRSPFVTEGYVDINPAGRQGTGRRGRRLRVDRRRPGGPALPRLAEERAGLRVRPAALPRPLLSGHAARRDADVVQHVRRHARLAAGTAGARRTAWPRTRGPNYQAMFRSGSHQSATRGWLKPTWMTDSLVRKDDVRPGASARASCPTCTARPARRASRS